MTPGEMVLIGFIILFCGGALWWWWSGIEESRLETLEDEVFKEHKKRKRKQLG